MRYFAFLSRHIPTEEQVILARNEGITLVAIGDMDAFTVTPFLIREKGVSFLEKGIIPESFSGVVVVHPAAALRLRIAFDIGIFENASRAEEGEKPIFYAKAFHLYKVTEISYTNIV